jgi:hypothetical protein
VIGVLIWGYAVRVFGRQKLPVLLGAGVTGALLLLLAGADALPPVALALWLGLFGFFSAYLPVLIAHGKSLFDARLVGRGITLLNMGTMAGAFASQIVSGAVIGLFPTHGGGYPLEAYRVIFALQAVFLMIAMGVYARAHDPVRTAR